MSSDLILARKGTARSSATFAKLVFRSSMPPGSSLCSRIHRFYWRLALFYDKPPYKVDEFPRSIRLIAKSYQEAYAVHALRAIMYKGTTPLALLGEYLLLAAFTAVMVIIATLAFKRPSKGENLAP